jgi:membrane-associated phospholipid phosphatase
MKEKSFKSILKSYWHILLPLLYGPFYFLVFAYLEKRPVECLHIIESSLDAYIPFCEYFIIPYYMWFGYIAISVIVFMFLDKKEYFRLCIMLGAGMTIFLFISYIYPNGLQIRPTEFARDNIFVDLVRVLHRADTSTNVLPSIHCYNSMVVHAAIRKNKTLAKFKWIKPLSFVLCISILMSTVFLKQHSVIDMIAAYIMFVIFYIPMFLIPEWQAKKIVHSKLS